MKERSEMLVPRESEAEAAGVLNALAGGAERAGRHERRTEAGAAGVFGRRCLWAAAGRDERPGGVKERSKIR